MKRQTWFRLIPVVLVAISSTWLSGCGSSNSDAAYYVGDEEATREHMREVEDEERIHFRETNGAQAGAPVGNTVEDQERANRQQQGG